MDVAVDLGTANVLVYVKGRGIVLREPSVVAQDRDSGRVVAVGAEARRMLGRTPGHIVAVRPLREGVIADFDLTQVMLRHFLGRVTLRRALFRPRVMVCVPTGITDVERRAVVEAASQSGAGQTYLVEEPWAAALGASLDISEPAGQMVVDIGGGTTDIAVLSLGGIVLGTSVRVAGDKFDDAIVKYVRRRYNLLIGERTAEDLKVNVAAVLPEVRDVTADVRGRDLVTGLPATVQVTTAELAEGLRETTGEVVAAIRGVLERTPPELAADIVDRGLVMTGGGSLLAGLDQLVARETCVPVHVADDPLSCVVIGAGKALEAGRFGERMRGRVARGF